MKARILVIEDEMSINDLLCMNLEIAGYETVGYLDGNEAYEAIIQDHAFQCALVDIMLPGRDGYSLLPKLKQYEIPVIFLTAKGDIASKIKGLKDGAEDYIVKPFEMLEVMVRLEKVLERNGTVQEQIGDVIIDTSSRTVTKMGMEIYLKPMEYNCLMVFAKNPNKALTRNQILQELWNEEFCGETRTVDAHVGRIRKKLGWQDKIKTIPRIGYRLEVERSFLRLHVSFCWYRQGSFSIPLIVGKIRVYRISTVMKAVYSEQISYSLKIKQAFLTIRNRIPTTKCAPK